MTEAELKAAGEAQLSTARAFILVTINDAGVMASASVLGTPAEQMAMASQCYAYHQAITSAEAVAIMADVMEGAGLDFGAGQPG